MEHKITVISISVICGILIPVVATLLLLGIIVGMIFFLPACEYGLNKLNVLEWADVEADYDFALGEASYLSVAFRHVSADHEQLEVLSWSWYIYTNVYYSYTADKPDYIYDTRSDTLYFRTDYDYMSKDYSVETDGNALVFCMSDIIHEEAATELAVDLNTFGESIPVALTEHPEVSVSLYVYQYSDGCYASLYEDTDTAYRLSDAFVSSLQECGYLTKSF